MAQHLLGLQKLELMLMTPEELDALDNDTLVSHMCENLQMIRAGMEPMYCEFEIDILRDLYGKKLDEYAADPRYHEL